MAAKEVVQTLLRLSLPRDALAITRLDLPENTDLRKATPRQLYDVGEHFASLWRASILTPLDDLDTAAIEEGETREDAWSRLNLVTAYYYDHCTRDFVSAKRKLPKAEPLAPGLRLKARDTILDELDAEASGFQRWAAALYFQHISCYIASSLVTLFAALPSRQARALGDRAVVTHIDGAFRLIKAAPHENLRLLAEHLVQAELAIANEIYSAEAVFNREHVPGVYSALRPDELALLAARDRTLLKRYGEDSAAAAFEQQLALLLQSLGFFVVRTRPGERTVDLVCISADPTERTTVIVEAKSTARPYALPTKDERALLEYVDEVRRTLTTLGPLRYVLLVGPRASKSLPKKLRRLEADAGVPVRFATAGMLAALREQVPGHVPMRALTEAILLGDPVLSDDFARAAVERYRTEQDAHERLVRSLLVVEAPG